MIIIIPYFRVMFLKRFILLLTTLLLLFADSGQTLYAHTCIKSKHTHITIGEPKHCCSEKSTKNHCGIKKASCCEITFKYLKQNFVSDSNQQYSLFNIDFSTFENVQKIKCVFNFHKQFNAYSPILLSSTNKACNSFTQNFRI